ncbi:hypothetical protein IH740_30865, partial [Escherichia coli]|nr:hypothetical protein [Escherichia coli]
MGLIDAVCHVNQIEWQRGAMRNGADRLLAMDGFHQETRWIGQAHPLSATWAVQRLDDGGPRHTGDAFEIAPGGQAQAEAQKACVLGTMHSVA